MGGTLLPMRGLLRKAWRWAWNALAALSLLLCVGVCVLWVRSYWVVDCVGYEGREYSTRWQRGGSLLSIGGTIRCEGWLRQNPPTSPPGLGVWAYQNWPLRTPTDDTSLPWHRVTYAAEQFINGPMPSDGRPAPAYVTYLRRLTRPHALLLAVTFFLAAFWLLIDRRLRRNEFRFRHNRCTRCGYDLRATPDASELLDRCPECGTARAQAAPAAGRLNQ